MKKIVVFDGEQFLCEYFFDIDSQIEGVDITYLKEEKYVGALLGITIPDEKDEEEVSNFEKRVTNYLTTKDVNYGRL